MVSIANVVLFAALATTALVGGGVVWGEVLRRRRVGQPLIEFAPRRPVPWSVIELAAVIGAYVAMAAGAFWLTKPPASDDATQLLNIESLLAMAAVSTLATVFALILVRFGSGAMASDLGLETTSVRYDAMLGVMAFAAILGPVYLVQALLGLLTETRHPIIELLQEDPNPAFFAAAGLAAVLVAPVAEEFFFRVLLQGWLEKMWWQRLLPADSTCAPPPSVPSPADDNPYTSPNAPLVEGTANQADPGRAAWGPILVSSAIFALMHAGHGPDPIPLFFLAVVLGYLYARTHRIWPGMVLHVLLNGCSLAMLWAGAGA